MAHLGSQDLYEVLQVSPGAHPLIITKAFRLLAALYHPDTKQTGDEEKFKQVVEAYRILSDPIGRAAYDKERGGLSEQENGANPIIDENRLSSSSDRYIDEQEMRLLTLRALYDSRRGSPYKPGLPLLVLSELFGCTIENLHYTLWYLRGKRFIETGEDSDVMITVEGVDYLEANNLASHRIKSANGNEPIVSLPLPSDAALDGSLEGRGSRNGTS